jgi:transcriptional regulator NrdR family protein
MKCPKCDTRLFCKDSRPVSGTEDVRRRYECPACKSRFTTCETFVSDERGRGRTSSDRLREKLADEANPITILSL